MSYCRKLNREVSIAHCLACDECLPPFERHDARLCEHECFKGVEFGLEEYAHERFPKLKKSTGYDLNEDLRNSFIDGGNFILNRLPKWKMGTPPYKGWWLTRTTNKDGTVSIACESFVDDTWPHEGDGNVLYLDMNDLENLPIEKK